MTTNISLGVNVASLKYMNFFCDFGITIAGKMKSPSNEIFSPLPWDHDKEKDILYYLIMS